MNSQIRKLLSNFRISVIILATPAIEIKFLILKNPFPILNIRFEFQYKKSYQLEINFAIFRIYFSNIRKSFCNIRN